MRHRSLLAADSRCRVRYDGKPVMHTPKFEQLSEAAQKLLTQKTVLDHKLYQLAVHRWQALVAAEGEDFQAELAEFRAAQASLRHICTEAAAHPACVWYKLNDAEFLRLIDTKTYLAEPVPFEIV